MAPTRRSGDYARLSRTAAAKAGIGGRLAAAMLCSICLISNMEMITTPSGLLENANRSSRSLGDFEKSIPWSFGERADPGPLLGVHVRKGLCDAGSEYAVRNEHR